jgi:hypothetical protein
MRGIHGVTTHFYFYLKTGLLAFKITNYREIQSTTVMFLGIVNKIQYSESASCVITTTGYNSQSPSHRPAPVEGRR